MKDCRNCGELECDYKHRECWKNTELHEKWWNFIHTTDKTDKQIEKRLRRIVAVLVLETKS